MATICGAGVGCKPSASATTSQTTQTTPVVRPVQNFEHIAITLPNPAMKTLTTLLLTCLLTACGSVQYQPLATIDHIDHSRGYRLQNLFQNNQDDDLLLVLLISGGGSRAAAFGYGVLEVLAATPITGHGKTATMLEKTDLVHGVSGGSVLATYLALHGKETVPRFEREFLQQNLQSTVLRQLFPLPTCRASPARNTGVATCSPKSSTACSITVRPSPTSPRGAKGRLPSSAPPT